MVRVLNAGLLGVGVALVCFLVPPQALTVPLAPLIGGLVGGYRAGASGGAVPLVGLTVAIGTAAPTWLLGAVVWPPVPADLSELGVPLAGAAILVYGALLGGLGAFVGGWVRRSV